jgi:hypothetical protein
MMLITRNGRHVPPDETDQADSDMLVRTVSRYTSGASIDRPQLCVSPELCDGDIERTRQLAERLDRNGYLPPATPMKRAEWLGHRKVIQSDVTAEIIWQVCGLGVPLIIALERAGIPQAKQKNQRRKIHRAIKHIGWDGHDAGSPDSGSEKP